MYRIQTAVFNTKEQCEDEIESMRKKGIDCIIAQQWHYTGKTCLWCCRVAEKFQTREEAHEAADRLEIFDRYIVNEKES